VLQRCAGHDAYFLPGYQALAERRGEGEARLFVFDHGEHTIALPLLLRPLRELPELGSAAGAWRDATSAYGYAGPLVSHENMPAAVVRAFHGALAAELRERRVISAFSRLHPLLPQREVLAGLGECQPLGETVSIDLTLPPAAQCAQYGATARSRINRLRRDGLTCELEAEKRRLPEFIEIYHETMRRVGAQNAYFFEEEYFRGLVENLGPALHLFLAMDRGEILAGGLFTLCDGIVQYHLGGTRDAALKLSPMLLLLDGVRLWANEQGARAFHLGGGVGSKADSLFHFKTRFSDRRHEFATWRWIVAPDVCAQMAEARRRWNEERGLQPISSDFFPAYRCPARQPQEDAVALPHG
jgi:hypothetical protein